MARTAKGFELVSVSPRGWVRLEAIQGRLRVRTTWQGRRYTASIGWPDTPTFRAYAQTVILQIERDQEQDAFVGLEKYKRKQKSDRFRLHKNLGQRLIQKFNRADYALMKNLEHWGKPIGSPEDARKFFDWLCKGRSKTLAPATQKRYLATCQVCDPANFEGIRVRVPPKPVPMAYTMPQIKAILDFLQSDKHYGHYHEFVMFLLFTGCRLSEAVALRWGNVDFDGDLVWFRESLATEAGGKPRLKETKTGVERFCPLHPLVRDRLYLRAGEPDDLVFPAPDGGFINAANFTRRCWRRCLEAAGVQHKPHETTAYKTRHSFISHNLRQGADPTELASLTGHSPQTMQRHYASLTRRPQIPDDLYGLDVDDD